VPPGFTPFRQ
uniref:[Val1,Hyp2,Thr6]-bradykinyl-Gln n=1 Tax=Pithecopus hypochondrialis TaxID=317381 RepID=BRK6_PITHY|nr:RecName: Full=[Val1,Hyp2,Thr6]-bradykinyl-Gln [Pithecopus hypochondrialis]